MLDRITFIDRIILSISSAYRAREKRFFISKLSLPPSCYILTKHNQFMLMKSWPIKNRLFSEIFVKNTKEKLFFYDYNLESLKNSSLVKKNIHGNLPKKKTQNRYF